MPSQSGSPRFEATKIRENNRSRSGSPERPHDNLFKDFPSDTQPQKTENLGGDSGNKQMEGAGGEHLLNASQQNTSEEKTAKNLIDDAFSPLMTSSEKSEQSSFSTSVASEQTQENTESTENTHTEIPTELSNRSNLSETHYLLEKAQEGQKMNEKLQDASRAMKDMRNKVYNTWHIVRSISFDVSRAQQNVNKAPQEKKETIYHTLQSIDLRLQGMDQSLKEIDQDLEDIGQKTYDNMEIINKALQDTGQVPQETIQSAYQAIQNVEGALHNTDLRLQGMEEALQSADQRLQRTEQELQERE